MFYVIAQFICIIFIIFSTNFWQLSHLSALLLLMSAIVGGTALANMGLDNLNVKPTLKDNHQLRTKGIYRYIAHPMYSAVLLLCLALVLSNITIINLTVYILLLVVLVLKSKKEEEYLLERFRAYKTYRNTVGQFLPKFKI